MFDVHLKARRRFRGRCLAFHGRVSEHRGALFLEGLFKGLYCIWGVKGVTYASLSSNTCAQRQGWILNDFHKCWSHDPCSHERHDQRHGQEDLATVAETSAACRVSGCFERGIS